jgi:hypothetical protein
MRIAFQQSLRVIHARKAGPQIRQRCAGNPVEKNQNLLILISASNPAVLVPQAGQGNSSGNFMHAADSSRRRFC